MKFLKKYKTSLFIVVIVIIATIAYTLLLSGNDEKLLVSETPSDAGTAAEGDLLSILLDLRSVKLDDGIFADSVFKSLEDFGQELVSEPVGRENPFAPLGTGGSISE